MAKMQRWKYYIIIYSILAYICSDHAKYGRAEEIAEADKEYGKRPEGHLEVLHDFGYFWTESYQLFGVAQSQCR